MLNYDDSKLALKLMKIYFSFFKVFFFLPNYAETAVLTVYFYHLMNIKTSYNSVILFLLQVFVKKTELDTKMLSALLIGVNRAYPFAKGRGDS